MLSNPTTNENAFMGCNFLGMFFCCVKQKGVRTRQDYVQMAAQRCSYGSGRKDETDKTSLLLEEDNVALVLDESALTEGSPGGEDDRGIIIDVVLAEELLEAGGGFLSMVERHLREQMVGNVGVDDTVKHVVQELAERAVDGAEGSTLEVPDVLAVVGQLGVGVLEEGDENQPKVDKEIGDNVVLCHGEERGLERGVDEGSQGDKNSEVREDNVGEIAGFKDGRPGVKVGSPLAVVLARGVDSQVGGPTEQELNKHPEQGHNGGLLVQVNGLILLNNILLLGGQSNLGTGLGDKDLVLGHVSSGLVMLRVRDSPGVVGDQKERVQDPADGVVESLRSRERLVAALVGKDPDARADNTLHHPVDRPGQVTDQRVLKLVDLGSGQEEKRGPGEIDGNMAETTEAGTLEAVGRDALTDLLDCELGELIVALIGGLDGGSSGVDNVAVGQTGIDSVGRSHLCFLIVSIESVPEKFGGSRSDVK